MKYILKATDRDGQVFYATRNRRGHVELVRDKKSAAQFVSNEVTELIRRSKSKLSDWTFTREEVDE